MIIDGKAIAETILSEIQHKLCGTPSLAVIQVGEVPASTTYIRMKRRACEKVGIESRLIQLPIDVTENKLLKTIDELNHSNCSGILLQLPLPDHLDPHRMLEAIDPKKDVDGFHPINMGKLMMGLPGFVPCTPLGIHTLLVRSNISIAGKRVVIVGRSQIVGMPLAALLMQKREDCNATVTVVHSKTANMAMLTSQADILVAAIGKPRLIKKEMLKEGAVVIDVGINRENGKLTGDVDFEDVKDHCSAITPVPGGVGPMTVAMLMHNTVRACANS